ncbi:MAG: hypothetical protein ACP5I8_13270 [Phycisphaerae bacterium]
MSLASDFYTACATGLIPGAEQITYTPLGKSPITGMWATVDRAPPKRDSEAFSTSMSKTLTVNIANDAVYGVASIDTGGDTITLPLKIGDAPQTVKVRWPELHDAGIWQLRVG